jgi:hypothetical protein
VTEISAEYLVIYSAKELKASVKNFKHSIVVKSTENV